MNGAPSSDTLNLFSNIVETRLSLEESDQGGHNVFFTPQQISRYHAVVENTKSLTTKLETRSEAFINQVDVVSITY